MNNTCVARTSIGYLVFDISCSFFPSLSPVFYFFFVLFTKGTLFYYYCYYQHHKYIEHWAPVRNWFSSFSALLLPLRCYCCWSLFFFLSWSINFLLQLWAQSDWIGSIVNASAQSESYTEIQFSQFSVISFFKAKFTINWPSSISPHRIASHQMEIIFRLALMIDRWYKNFSMHCFVFPLLPSEMKVKWRRFFHSSSNIIVPLLRAIYSKRFFAGFGSCTRAFDCCDGIN